MELFGSTFRNLESGLKYSSLKNQTIAHNIANVDTPYYKAKNVSFKNHLNQASLQFEAKRTHPKHLPFSNIEQGIIVTARKNVTYNNNGNSVDLDKEMAELAKNQLYYEALIDRVNGKFNSIKTVLGGGN
ncbi:flagellar basal body rod protein FlgB [Bacillaceae bacterium W0354]